MALSNNQNQTSSADFMQDILDNEPGLFAEFLQQDPEDMMRMLQEVDGESTVRKITARPPDGIGAATKPFFTKSGGIVPKRAKSKRIETRVTDESSGSEYRPEIKTKGKGKGKKGSPKKAKVSSPVRVTRSAAKVTESKKAAKLKSPTKKVRAATKTPKVHNTRNRQSRKRSTSTDSDDEISTAPERPRMLSPRSHSLIAARRTQRLLQEQDAAIEEEEEETAGEYAAKKRRKETFSLTEEQKDAFLRGDVINDTKSDSDQDDDEFDSDVDLLYFVNKEANQSTDKAVAVNLNTSQNVSMESTTCAPTVSTKEVKTTGTFPANTVTSDVSMEMAPVGGQVETMVTDMECSVSDEIVNGSQLAKAMNPAEVSKGASSSGATNAAEANQVLQMSTDACELANGLAIGVEGQALTPLPIQPVKVPTDNCITELNVNLHSAMQLLTLEATVQADVNNVDMTPPQVPNAPSSDVTNSSGLLLTTSSDPVLAATATTISDPVDVTMTQSAVSESTLISTKSSQKQSESKKYEYHDYRRGERVIWHGIASSVDDEKSDNSDDELDVGTPDDEPNAAPTLDHHNLERNTAALDSTVMTSQHAENNAKLEEQSSLTVLQQISPSALLPDEDFASLMQNFDEIVNENLPELLSPSRNLNRFSEPSAYRQEMENCRHFAALAAGGETAARVESASDVSDETDCEDQAVQDYTSKPMRVGCQGRNDDELEKEGQGCDSITVLDKYHEKTAGAGSDNREIGEEITSKDSSAGERLDSEIVKVVVFMMPQMTYYSGVSTVTNNEISSEVQSAMAFLLKESSKTVYKPPEDIPLRLRMPKNLLGAIEAEPRPRSDDDVTLVSDDDCQITEVSKGKKKEPAVALPLTTAELQEMVPYCEKGKQCAIRLQNNKCRHLLRARSSYVIAPFCEKKTICKDRAMTGECTHTEHARKYVAQRSEQERLAKLLPHCSSDTMCKMRKNIGYCIHLRQAEDRNNLEKNRKKGSTSRGRGRKLGRGSGRKQGQDEGQCAGEPKVTEGRSDTAGKRGRGRGKATGTTKVYSNKVEITTNAGQRGRGSGSGRGRGRGRGREAANNSSTMEQNFKGHYGSQARPTANVKQKRTFVSKFDPVIITDDEADVIHIEEEVEVLPTTKGSSTGVDNNTTLTENNKTIEECSEANVGITSAETTGQQSINVASNDNKGKQAEPIISDLVAVDNDVTEADLNHKMDRQNNNSSPDQPTNKAKTCEKRRKRKLDINNNNLSSPNDVVVITDVEDNVDNVVNEKKNDIVVLSDDSDVQIDEQKTKIKTKKKTRGVSRAAKLNDPGHRVNESAKTVEPSTQNEQSTTQSLNKIADTAGNSSEKEDGIEIGSQVPRWFGDGLQQGSTNILSQETVEDHQTAANVSVGKKSKQNGDYVQKSVGQREANLVGSVTTASHMEMLICNSEANGNQHTVVAIAQEEALKIIKGDTLTLQNQQHYDAEDEAVNVHDETNEYEHCDEQQQHTAAYDSETVVEYESDVETAWIWDVVEDVETALNNLIEVVLFIESKAANADDWVIRRVMQKLVDDVNKELHPNFAVENDPQEAEVRRNNLLRSAYKVMFDKFCKTANKECRSSEVEISKASFENSETKRGKANKEKTISDAPQDGACAETPLETCSKDAEKEDRHVRTCEDNATTQSLDSSRDDALAQAYLLSSTESESESMQLEAMKRSCGSNIRDVLNARGICAKTAQAANMKVNPLSMQVCAAVAKPGACPINERVKTSTGIENVGEKMKQEIAVPTANKPENFKGKGETGENSVKKQISSMRKPRYEKADIHEESSEERPKKKKVVNMMRIKREPIVYQDEEEQDNGVSKRKLKQTTNVEQYEEKKQKERNIVTDEDEVERVGKQKLQKKVKKEPVTYEEEDEDVDARRASSEKRLNHRSPEFVISSPYSVYEDNKMKKKKKKRAAEEMGDEDETPRKRCPSNNGTTRRKLKFSPVKTVVKHGKYIAAVPEKDESPPKKNKRKPKKYEEEEREKEEIKSRKRRIAAKKSQNTPEQFVKRGKIVRRKRDSSSEESSEDENYQPGKETETPVRRKISQDESLPPDRLFHSCYPVHVDDGKFKCHSCDVSFHSMVDLYKHKDMHFNHPPDPRLIQFCKLCTKSFSSLTHLNIHMQQRHNEQGRLPE